MAGSGASKLSQSMGKFDIKGADKGRLTATKSARTGRTMAGRKSNINRANKAFGQLKVAKGNSALGASASSAEGARSASAAAFDGQNADASNVAGGPGVGTASVPQNPGGGGGGGGAPDMTAPATTAGIGNQTAQTAAMIAAIAAMLEAAVKMKAQGEKLIIIGAILCALSFIPFCGFLMVIGLILIGAGIAMMEQAKLMEAMANSMSAALAANTTDQNQHRINQYCIGQASNGVPPANCNPPSSVTNQDTFRSTENEGLRRHQRMIKENGYVEGNGEPTPP